MNIRNMKLALSVDLINLPSLEAPVLWVKNAMNRFSSETGDLTGFLETSAGNIRDGIESKTIELQYEHCTLDLELIRNSSTSKEYIKGFDLKANFA